MGWNMLVGKKILYPEEFFKFWGQGEKCRPYLRFPFHSWRWGSLSLLETGTLLGKSHPPTQWFLSFLHLNVSRNHMISSGHLCHCPNTLGYYYQMVSFLRFPTRVDCWIKGFFTEVFEADILVSHGQWSHAFLPTLPFCTLFFLDSHFYFKRKEFTLAMC